MSENHLLVELEGTWRLINTKPSLYRWGLVNAMAFPVVIYGCESWTIKNTHQWGTVVLEKTLESPVDSREIKPVHPKGNQPWVFIGRTDVEAEALVLCHLIRKSDLLERTLMLGKIEGKRRRGRQKMRWLDGIVDSMDMNVKMQVSSRVWLFETP